MIVLLGSRALFPLAIVLLHWRNFRVRTVAWFAA